MEGRRPQPNWLQQTATYAQGIAVIIGLLAMIVGAAWAQDMRVTRLEWMLTEHLRWTQEEQTRVEKRAETLLAINSRLAAIEAQLGTIHQQIRDHMRDAHRGGL